MCVRCGQQLQLTDRPALLRARARGVLLGPDRHLTAGPLSWCAAACFLREGSSGCSCESRQRVAKVRFSLLASCTRTRPPLPVVVLAQFADPREPSSLLGWRPSRCLSLELIFFCGLADSLSRATRRAQRALQQPNSNAPGCAGCNPGECSSRRPVVTGLVATHSLLCSKQPGLLVAGLPLRAPLRMAPSVCPTAPNSGVLHASRSASGFRLTTISVRVGP